MAVTKMIDTMGYTLTDEFTPIWKSNNLEGVTNQEEALAYVLRFLSQKESVKKMTHKSISGEAVFILGNNVVRLKA